MVKVHNDMRINKVTASELVCEKIKENIKNGTWRINERLPSENDLADMFGVNRLTVRSALQKLNALGIVETRTGSGSYIVEFDFTDHIKEVSVFYMEPELLENVSEVRELVEIECVKLAIERGTPEEFEKLEELIQDYSRKQVVRLHTPTLKNIQICAQADVAFHKQIVDMAHNKLFSYAFTVAQQSIYQYVLILDKKRVEHSTLARTDEKVLSIHKNIFLAMKSGDFERCKEYYKIMVNHKLEL
jgi:GntR family transcriptional repressor for pyruvate dehydrogenase complex